MRFLLVWLSTFLFLVAADVVTLNNTTNQKYDLIHQAFLFIDKNTTTYSAIGTKPFVPLKENKPLYAEVDNLWFKMTINNQTNQQKWYLTSEYRWPEIVEVFVENETGTQFYKMGERVPYSERSFVTADPSFAIDLAGGENVIYMNVRSMDFKEDLVLESVESFVTDETTKMLLQGLFLGIGLALVLYNLLLAITMRSSIYGYYVAYMLSMLIFIEGDNGIIFRYLRPEMAYLNGLDKLFFVGIGSVFLLLFSIRFLELDTYAKRLSLAMKVYGAFIMLVIFMHFVYESYTTLMAINNILLAVPLFVIMAIVISHRRGYEPVKMYALGYSFFILFSILTLLNNMHVIDMPEATAWGLSLGIAFEGVLFSYAIYRRLRFDEEERKRFEEEGKRKDRLLQIQSRMAGMGEMMGNITHQWKQPIATIGATVSNLDISNQLGAIDSQELDRSLHSINEQLDLMQQTSRDFLNYYKPDKEAKIFSVNTTIHQAIKFTKGTLIKNQIAFSFKEPSKSVEIFGFTNELNQVLINIINNAKDALIEKRESDRKVIITLTQEADSVVTRIADNAGGIPEHIMEKIFDAYFTTKENSNGTGIGLHMSKQIVEESMNGELSVENGPEGAVFIIKFSAI